MKTLNKSTKLIFVSLLIVLMLSTTFLLGLVIVNVTAAVDSDTWSYSGHYTTSLLTQKNGYYLINSEEDLAGMNMKPGTYFGSNSKIKLCANLDMSDYYWKPSSTTFSGEFDGQGFTISNLKMKNPGTSANSAFDNAGLFQTTTGATIKHLNIYNFAIYGVHCSGVIAGKSYGGRISNISIDYSFIYARNCEDKVLSSNNHCGGVCGAILNSCVVENCKVLNSNIYSVNRSEYAKNNKKDKSNMKLVGGAIAGYSHNSTISKCISRLNTVSAKSTYLIYAHAVGLGGIVGHADAGSVSECYSTSTIEGGKKDGSRYSSAYAYITKVDTAYLGGIVGQSTGCTITACFNTGSISGYAKNSSTSTELLSSEKITTNNRYYIYTAVNNSNNTKKITTFYNCYIGGIVGNSNSSVSNCYNTGTLTSYSPASTTKYVYGFGVTISGLRQCAFYIEQTGAVVTVNNICGNNCTKDKCYTNKSIYSGIPSYKATVLFGPCYSDYSGHYGDWESFEWNTTTISDALNKKYFNEDNVWLSNTYNSTDIRTYVEDSAVYKLTIERNPRYPQISLKTVGYAGTVNSSDHSAISLKTITFSFLYNDATTGLVVSSNALSPSYFAVDSNINGGLPHLKCFYWQDNVGDLTSNPDPTPTPDPTPGPKPEIM